MENGLPSLFCLVKAIPTPLEPTQARCYANTSLVPENGLDHTVFDLINFEVKVVVKK
jgi:hypothetical protein